MVGDQATLAVAMSSRTDDAGVDLLTIAKSCDRVLTFSLCPR